MDLYNILWPLLQESRHKITVFIVWYISCIVGSWKHLVTFLHYSFLTYNKNVSLAQLLQIKKCMSCKELFFLRFQLVSHLLRMVRQCPWLFYLFYSVYEVHLVHECTNIKKWRAPKCTTRLFPKKRRITIFLIIILYNCYVVYKI